MAPQNILPALARGGGPAKPVEGFLSVTRARRLRREMSPTELRLWSVLRQRPAGLQFRRQHPLGPFVLDFFCRSAALAIEVDGMAHDFEARANRDAMRDEWLTAKGVATLRIPAAEVHRNLEGVITYIVSLSLGRTPPPHDVRSPSPPKRGEDDLP